MLTNNIFKETLFSKTKTTVTRAMTCCLQFLPSYLPLHPICARNLQGIFTRE